MLETGVSPADPARWWIAHAVERERADRERETNATGTGNTAHQDIEVLNHDAHTQ